MRIGLVRHFPVTEPWPKGWLTSVELHHWRERYDAAEVSSSPVADETPNWARCYTSDLKRAAVTAEAMYRGEIIPLAALREVESAPMGPEQLRLPVWTWRLVYRFAWMIGHSSQKHLRDRFLTRLRSVADLIEKQEEDALLVSHAGMMLYLHRELLRRGFRGTRFTIADHARVYVFER